MNTAIDVAHWFASAIDREAGDSITHLKVQKLVYYAQAWSLALRDTPLFDEDLQAWAHGPVAESVYRHYEGMGWNALPQPEAVGEFEAAEIEILHDVLGAYGGFAAKELEEMTHAEGPWRQARGTLPPEARSQAIISKESMSSFYRDLYQSADAEE